MASWSAGLLALTPLKPAWLHVDQQNPQRLERVCLVLFAGLVVSVIVESHRDATSNSSPAPSFFVRAMHAGQPNGFAATAVAVRTLDL